MTLLFQPIPMMPAMPRAITNCFGGCCSESDLSGFEAVDLTTIAANINTPEKLVERITIESKWGPGFDIDKPFEGPSTVGPFLQFVKPRVTIQVKGIDKPLVYAPYGAPDPKHWPVVRFAGAVVGVGLLVLAAYGAKKAIVG